jgi:hypothetical protein
LSKAHSERTLNSSFDTPSATSPGNGAASPKGARACSDPRIHAVDRSYPRTT